MGKILSSGSSGLSERFKSFRMASDLSRVMVLRVLPCMVQHPKNLHHAFFLAVHQQEGRAPADETFEGSGDAPRSARRGKGVNQGLRGLLDFVMHPLGGGGV